MNIKTGYDINFGIQRLAIEIDNKTYYVEILSEANNDEVAEALRVLAKRIEEDKGK